MGGSIQVPNNIEDKTILKRFLTDLVLGINSNTLFSGNVQEQNAALVELLQVNPNVDFINIVSKLTELRSNILTYVEDNIETVILQNTKDIAVIAEQFGTFYNQALAASWYGLSVKAGGVVAGLEVGSLDPDVTTPGDESSYFRIVANNFILGRAYEDLTQAEKAYLAANNLPNFGTVYNAQKQPVPALVTTWDSTAGVYKHYFNGIVQFSNIAGADYANAINNGTTTINGGKITTNTLEANRLKASTNGQTTWTGGALISNNFNGNAVGNIGNPTQGFRLSSDAGGSSSDPNIYGAYIKGSTIDIETLKVQSTTPGNSGRVIKFQLDGYIYMHSYGTGFLDSRVCSVDKSFVKVEGWYRAATNYLVAYLQYSTDSINWNNLAVKDAQQYGYQEYFYIYFAELFNPSLVANTSQVSFRIIGNVGGTASPILISIYNN